LSEPVHAGDRRVARGRILVAAGGILLTIGLERLANSYLLGGGSALVSLAADRFLVGLVLSGVGSVLVIVGLGDTSRARRSALPGHVE
jgi:hypothetical protein